MRDLLERIDEEIEFHAFKEMNNYVAFFEKIKAYIQELETENEQLKINDWQPIATAPTDRQILIYTKNQNMWVAIHTESLETGDKAYLIASASDGHQMIVPLGKVLNWMELPQPPKEQS